MMFGRDLYREIAEALRDKRLSSEVIIKPTSFNFQPKKYVMTMDEVREIDKKRREAFLEEWAPIIEVMES
jgi:hypothetical protein